MLANPPFGVKWEAEKDCVDAEHENQGFSGRFGAGTPRINDGSFLFLQHMISKMKKLDDGGTRLGIVFNGSPLFTDDAGSRESKRDEQDGEVGIVGYEIPLNRHFYVYQPPRELAGIEADIAKLEKEIVAKLREVVA